MTGTRRKPRGPKAYYRARANAIRDVMEEYFIVWSPSKSRVGVHQQIDQRLERIVPAAAVLTVWRIGGTEAIRALVREHCLDLIAAHAHLELQS